MIHLQKGCQGTTSAGGRGEIQRERARVWRDRLSEWARKRARERERKRERKWRDPIPHQRFPSAACWRPSARFQCMSLPARSTKLPMLVAPAKTHMEARSTRQSPNGGSKTVLTEAGVKAPSARWRPKPLATRTTERLEAHSVNWSLKSASKAEALVDVPSWQYCRIV